MKNITESGLTEDEQKCHDALCLAHKIWLALPQQHPGETQEFIDALHRIQNLLTIRIARRCYPDYWPTHDIDSVGH